MLHELIDPDEPKCLYCNQEILDNATGLRSSNYSSGYNANINSDAETLYCVDCKETFEIYYIQYEDGYTTYQGFSFTCKGYCIYNIYTEKNFNIYDKNDKTGKVIATIPEFLVNFSDREKLYDKIKTYILFS